MQYNITYNPDKNILKVVVSGRPDLAQMSEIFDIIYASDQYPPNMNSLWDMRNFDLHLADYNELQQVISLRSKYIGWESFRKAFVVLDDEKLGYFRLYQDVSNAQLNRKLRIFTDYDEAEKWLQEDG